MFHVEPMTIRQAIECRIPRIQCSHNQLSGQIAYFDQESSQVSFIELRGRIIHK